MKKLFALISILFCFNAEAATKINHQLNNELFLNKDQSILHLKKDNDKYFLKNKKQVKPKDKKLHYSAKLAIFSLPLFILFGILFNPIGFIISGLVFFTGLIIGIRMAKKYPEKYQAGWAKGLLWAGVMYAVLFGLAFISIAYIAD